jgi:uncharacterized protein (DUF1015 family)
MPSIKPFKAVIYNKKKITDLKRVVAPPYDVISPELQSKLYSRHKHNIVRLILGRIEKTDSESDNRYTRAAKFFEEWLKSGILVADDENAIYVYSQNYRLNGKLIDRTGFMSLMELELSGNKGIKPHENTLRAPKEDRLKLMKATNANLCPIFMLYEDAGDEIGGILKKACKKKPFIDINLDGVRNRVWKLTEGEAIRKIADLMAAKDIFIADGHHRYETAKNFFAHLSEAGAPAHVLEKARYTLALFCKLDDDKLTILPTHRLIKDMGSLAHEEVLRRLNEKFTVREFNSAKKLMDALRKSAKRHAFGMYPGGKKYYCLILKSEKEAHERMGEASRDWKSLDVSILHLYILQNILDISDEDDNIEFVKDAEEALELIDRKRFKLAFILNPTKVSQVKKVAQAGEKMPRKATFFYPKPLSGLVIRKM